MREISSGNATLSLWFDFCFCFCFLFLFLSLKRFVFEAFCGY